MRDCVWFFEILSFWVELKIWTSIMLITQKRGGHEKIWKFPDLTKLWWWGGCHRVTWQDNCRCEQRQWVRNHTELEWWPSWTIPAIFWQMPISPRCRNYESRNKSVMHQSEMEVYQIFLHQSIVRQLMKKWYIHHLPNFWLRWGSRKPTSQKTLVSRWIRSAVKSDFMVWK